MLKIRPMWKCGSDGIYFNNFFCVFVEILYHPKLGAVRLFCVVNECAGPGPTEAEHDARYVRHRKAHFMFNSFVTLQRLL
jgi:hypothetical protein